MYTQKNSNHRSHLRAMMALDHSRLGLENEFSENKSGRIFDVRQVYLTKCSISQFFKTNIQNHRSTRGLLAKPFKKFQKTPIRPAGSHF